MHSLNQTFYSKKVIVTGHTGFKGSWLSKWLVTLGAEIYGVSIDVPSHPSHFSVIGLDREINDIRLDIKDTRHLNQLFLDIKPDFVFHLAAQSLVGKSYENPPDTWQVNTIGTMNVLEALRQLKNQCVVVLITSDKAYKNNEWIWGYRENDALGGNDPYSASKASAELVINSYIHSFFEKEGNIRIGIGRAGNVIGGGDWADRRIVPDCARSWAQNQIVPIRNPNATRPWQHVLEPLSGYLALAGCLHKNNEFHGEAFNFGPQSNHDYSVADLANEMKIHWNQAQWINTSQEADNFYESKLLKLNCDKALHLLDWRSIWDFNTTVRETALWYKKYYASPKALMTKFTLAQISDYTSCANKLGLSWAK